MNWEIYWWICAGWCLFSIIEYTNDVGKFSFSILIAAVINFVFCPIIMIIRILDFIFCLK